MPSQTIAVPSMFPGGLEASRSGHFGHCEMFTLVEVEDGKILDVKTVQNLPHQQGGCQAPVNLLHQNGADALIVGGIGMRPLMGFRQVGIDVYFGPVGETVQAAIDYLIQGYFKPIDDTQTCGGSHGGGSVNQ